MGYLRHARSAPSSEPPEQNSVAAFDRELDYIVATLRRLGARSPDLEDLVQEVFVVLHKKWPTLDMTRPLRPYLFGIAYRVCCAHRRRRRREVPVERLDVEDESLDPETMLQRKESTALLLAALDRVPLRRRAVIVMHELDDVPILEVARRLSMSQFGTYARWRKGRKELQAAMKRLMKKDGQ